jgi:enterochelin esterase-like enzyme
MRIYFLLLMGLTNAFAIEAQDNPVIASIAYLRDQAESPDQYLVKKFSTYNVVLLGEDHAISDNLSFVRRMIPQLYAAGVRNLGMEFGSVEMQKKVDSLMAAPEYNEQLVRDIMYFHNAAWPYTDYLEVYKSVWDFNRMLGKKQKKFRILHLSYQYDWSGFTGEMTPEKRRKVFHNGGDEFWANRVKEDVIGRGEKVLCLVGVPHAFTRYHQGYRNNSGSCKSDSIQFGQHLFREFPKKVFSILLNVPLVTRTGNAHAGAGNGAIELIMHNLNNRPAGFDLVNTPLGDLPDSSMFSICHDHFTLKDFFDGYIFLGPVKEMKGASVDKMFYANRSPQEVLLRQPDPYWFKANTLDELLRKIHDYADLDIRYTGLQEPSFPTVSSGYIQRFENFPSTYVNPRHVDVWLPEGYSPQKKYAVLYMHDGQMLYDSAKTWNRSAWDVDDAVAKLIANKKIRDVIVVGIWNDGTNRHVEYFPAKPFSLLTKQQQDSLFAAGRENGASLFVKPELQSDNYLKFLVTELKPFIDRTYSTMPYRKNTFVAGSSMGGLISLYAICEYPEIFGGAACISTHWPGVFPKERNPVPDKFFEYMRSHLPDPGTHKIYFDFGDQTLDAAYPPLQKQADQVMESRGYKSQSWQTRSFPGDDHSEHAWKRRLQIPLQFLLTND